MRESNFRDEWSDDETYKAHVLAIGDLSSIGIEPKKDGSCEIVVVLEDSSQAVDAVTARGVSFLLNDFLYINAKDLEYVKVS